MKIKSIAELKKIVKELKKKHKRIVFANGCFDILHVGHVRYLKAAKELGDYLIVGINSDKSTRLIKGEGRPLVREDERAEIVASIQYVDAVIIFDEPTAEKVLKELRPHIHAKGTDYTKETVPEKEVVKSYNGKIAIVGDKKTHSTKKLIRKIISS
jgi:rfaE bifunctional protein nucleotidyltransferase chain/domain